ncbi:MAG TPA: type II toxin-antitoxin system VapC family toxin [Spirochaetia bacterium]|nr:type II toxin-antitoxin system VapC family toxin [Spirochaetia bacterium]
MVLLDTNVFIYLANGTLAADVLGGEEIAFASITRIEALGFGQITVAEQNYLEELFEECEQLDLQEAVIRRAIKLRQLSKMTLGDAIIAATSLVYELELWTANTKDFSAVEGLDVRNPIKATE